MASRSTVAIALLALANASPDPASTAAADACASLNLTAQISMMRGYGQINGYSRNSGCANVCGRATFRWDNGPQGFGDGTIPGTTTQFPCSLAVAATWDPSLAEAFGTAMGEEFWGKGTNIQEGPGVNVARIMQNGRNFEYMSGANAAQNTLEFWQRMCLDKMQERILCWAPPFCRVSSMAFNRMSWLSSSTM